jgi:hypothetical protein
MPTTVPITLRLAYQLPTPNRPRMCGTLSPVGSSERMAKSRPRVTVPCTAGADKNSRWTFPPQLGQVGRAAAIPWQA